MMGWLIPVVRAAELRRRTQAKNDKSEKNRLTAGNGGKMTMTIKELRARTGLTQAAFAAALRIPKRSIENWEGGGRTPPAYLVELIEYRVTHDPDLTGSHNG